MRATLLLISLSHLLSRMNAQTDEFPATGRMWRIYGWCWFAYLLLLGLVAQLDGLRQGRIDWYVLLQLAKTAPNALCLALIWPLSGWIEKRRLPLVAAVLIHSACSLTFAAISYILLWYLVGLKQSFGWYIWPVMYAMMSYGVVAAVFHMVRANEARRLQAITIEQAHSLLLASELEALRSKLNPHFLFNTLHSIIALTRKDSGAAETALFQFSNMLRYVLSTEKNANSRVSLEDELRFVRDYLELESLRLGPRLQVKWELNHGAGHHMLPALSLQPLVENSIRHAFNPRSRPGQLVIGSHVDAEADLLMLSVNDDGPGADPAALCGSIGLGIRTVERRLQLEYGVRGALRVDTAPGKGFAVTMTVPLMAA